MKTVKILSILMVLCILFSSCAQGVGEVASNIVDNTKNNSVIDNVVSDIGSTENSHANQIYISNPNEAVPEKGTYKEVHTEE